MGFLGGLVALAGGLILIVLIGYCWEVRSERREWERMRRAAREKPIGEFLKIYDEEDDPNKPTSKGER